LPFLKSSQIVTLVARGDGGRLSLLAKPAERRRKSRVVCVSVVIAALVDHFNNSTSDYGARKLIMTLNQLSMLEQRKILVERLGISQEELAARFGVTAAFFCMWMKGKRESKKLAAGVAALYLERQTKTTRVRISKSKVVNVVHARRIAPRRAALKMAD